MKERILTFLFHAEDLSIFSFQCGYLLGVLASVFILLLLLLLGVLLRMPSKVPGVSIESASGTLFIAANAIKDLVKATGEDFPCFQILRVGLFRKKKMLFLQLQLNAASGREEGEMEKPAVETNLLDQSRALQEAILQNLKNRFGIESIEKIHIQLRRGSLQ